MGQTAPLPGLERDLLGCSNTGAACAACTAHTMSSGLAKRAWQLDDATVAATCTKCCSVSSQCSSRGHGLLSQLVSGLNATGTLSPAQKQSAAAEGAAAAAAAGCAAVGLQLVTHSSAVASAPVCFSWNASYTVKAPTSRMDTCPGGCNPAQNRVYAG
jgi:hypothetical protein